MCTPARQPTTWIGNEITLDDNNAQQVGQHRPAPTPDTGTDRRRTAYRVNCSARRHACLRHQVLAGWIGGHFDRTGLLGVAVNIDPPAGEPGGEPGILAFLADGQ